MPVVARRSIPEPCPADDHPAARVRVPTQEVVMHQGTPHSPVDDETYDLLQTLTSKLEALETYSKYEADTQGDAKQALQEIAEQDRQHAERLVGLLAGRLGNGSMSQSDRSMSQSGGSSMSQATASD
jgi:hypothetical protein